MPPQAGQVGGSDASGAVVVLPRGGAAVGGAAQLPDRPVKPDQVASAGALVQAVDVLGDQREARTLTPAGEHLVRRVRPRRGDRRAAPVVPLPHQLRIHGERFRRGELLGAELPPQPVVSAEGGDAARRRHACAGQYDGRLRRTEAGNQFFGVYRHRRHAGAFYVSCRDVLRVREP